MKAGRREREREMGSEGEREREAERGSEKIEILPPLRVTLAHRHAQRSDPCFLTYSGGGVGSYTTRVYTITSVDGASL